MQDFRRLRVTAQARRVITATYAFTATLPSDERFGLVSQMRRASISIGLNIAEGCGRSTTRELIRFLEIARSSGTELEFALVVTEDLGIGNSDRRAAVTDELIHAQKELSALVKALRRRMGEGSRQ